MAHSTTITPEQEALLPAPLPRLFHGDEMTCDVCDRWTHMEDIVTMYGSEEIYVCLACEAEWLCSLPE